MSEYPNGNRATEHWVEKVKSLQEEIKSLRQCIARLEKALMAIGCNHHSACVCGNTDMEIAKEALSEGQESD